jgi:hypothetical protein
MGVRAAPPDIQKYYYIVSLEVLLSSLLVGATLGLVGD